jgi:hypothetical protein
VYASYSAHLIAHGTKVNKRSSASKTPKQVVEIEKATSVCEWEQWSLTIYMGYGP